MASGDEKEARMNESLRTNIDDFHYDNCIFAGIVGGVEWTRRARNMGNVSGNTINDGEGNEHQEPVSSREVRHIGRPEVKANT